MTEEKYGSTFWQGLIKMALDAVPELAAMGLTQWLAAIVEAVQLIPQLEEALMAFVTGRATTQRVADIMPVESKSADVAKTLGGGE